MINNLLRIFKNILDKNIKFYNKRNKTDNYRFIIEIRRIIINFIFIFRFIIYYAIIIDFSPLLILCTFLFKFSAKFMKNFKWTLGFKIT